MQPFDPALTIDQFATQRLVFSGQPAMTQFLPADPSRVLWVGSFFVAAGNMWVDTAVRSTADMTTSPAGFKLVGTNQQSVEISYQHHGPLCQQAWFANTGGALWGGVVNIVRYLPRANLKR